MLQQLKKHALFSILIALLIAWTIFLIFVDPTEIVSFVGLENAYLATFLIAVFGGMSTITGTSFFIAIATFAAGGATPLLLGIFGGLGIFISDSLFFIIARRGVKEFGESSGKISQFILKHIRKLPPHALYFFVYLYLSFAPLPNDILMIALAFTGMSYKSLVLVLLAGDITTATITAIFGVVVL